MALRRRKLALRGHRLVAATAFRPALTSIRVLSTVRCRWQPEFHPSDYLGEALMFGRSLPLFKLAGFQVGVDWSWLLLAVLISWTLATGVFPSYYPDLSPGCQCRLNFPQKRRSKFPQVGADA